MGDDVAIRASDGLRLAEALRTVLPADVVVGDPDRTSAYRQDEALQVVGGTPAAVVLPTTTAQVVAAVQVAHSLGVAMVPRGAGTGLSGGAAAVDGCLVVCTTRMNRIVEIDTDNQYAVVEPGVITGDLDDAAAAVGLWYPPDPSSWRTSTLGGNIATDAGGLCCVRYGTTSDYVLGLEVVLADGRVLRTGRRTAKGVAGYDLTRLLVGSEGTLGIVTSATLRLRPRRPDPATVVAVFPTLVSAGEAVLALLRTGLSLSLLEIMDRTTIRAVEAHGRMGLDPDAAALLVLQTDVAAEHAAAERVCRETGAVEVHATTDPAESELLLQARRLALPALQLMGTVLLDDVAVPRSALPALIDAVEAVAAQTGLVIGTFGHAGDGNLHPTIVYDRADEAQCAAATTAFDGVLAAALELGGTITGEHGVGRLKSTWLTRELEPVALAVSRDVKAALDPLGLMNPGAVFSDQGQPRRLSHT
ncbi:MAG: FAD-linked oxidase C-terminal domain-containing protein [Mycobacteriales bacterium]